VGDSDTVLIRNASLEARVSLLGAELTRLANERVGNVLWEPDGLYWNQCSPILFPVIGRSRNGRQRIGDRLFPMPDHGFASFSRFEVVARDEDSCTLVLKDSSKTRKYYPFPFSLELRYALHGESLQCLAGISNPGSSPLPGSFGFHPGFKWPLVTKTPKSDYDLIFEEDRWLDCHRVIDGALAADVDRIQLVDHRLALSDELFTQSALVALSCRSSTIHYQERSSGTQVSISRYGLPHLAIWTRPSARFICVEPWHGHTRPVGFEGNLRDSPGSFLIEPGETRSFSMTLAIHCP